MSTDMFPDAAIEYILRHHECDPSDDHGPQCPDKAVS